MSRKRHVAICNALRFDDKGTRSARSAKDIFCPIRDTFDPGKVQTWPVVVHSRREHDSRRPADSLEGQGKVSAVATQQT